MHLLNSISVRLIKGFAVSKTARRVRMMSFCIDTCPQSVFPLVYCPANGTLFEVGPCRNTLFICVESLLLLWKPHRWFLANLKTLSQSMENWIRSLCQKIVSECCELVKLCYVILIVAVQFFYNILKQFEELIREKDSVYNDTLLFQHVCALFLDFSVIFSVR